jgi:hypothetical protein
VLEYGTGGSTMLALRHGVRKLASVESDWAWIQKLREKPYITRSERNGRLFLLHANVGSVGRLGMPVDANLPCSPYVVCPWKLDFAPDLILVDGRARVASILECFLRSSAPIVVHDFWPRHNYHVVLQFAEILDRVDTMAVIRRKNASASDIQATAAKYSQDWS